MHPPDVTIVGAGATGCTLALLLSRYGIASTVLERRSTAFNHPAAHVVNARSFEIWHRASPALALRIAALAPPVEEVATIRWCADLRSQPLGEINLLSDPELVERVKSHSQFLISHIGQHLLMPILWDAVEQDPLIDFRRGLRLERLTTRPAGTTVHARDPNAAPVAVSSRYVIGADGANSGVRTALGITMCGPVLANMGSVFFQAKLPGPNSARPLLSWIYTPKFSGVLIAHADDDYVLMTPFLSGQQPIARDSRTFWEHTLPHVIGRDVATEIHSTGTWTMTSQIADTFAKGGVILAGDAAHRFPHTGGFGLNSGVQDAHNLAWKLAAVLENRAPATLLDTYETERRPVVERFAAQSVTNHFKLDEALAGVSVSNRSLARVTTAFQHPIVTRMPAPVLGWIGERLTGLAMRRTVKLTGDSDRARYCRATVGRRIPAQLEHFASTGLEFGYAYSGPLIRSESAPQPLDGTGILRYRPTTWPGSRLPHALISHDGGTVTTHAVLDLRCYTLFTPDPQAWQEALSSARSATVIALEPAMGTNRDNLLDLFEIGERGAVLVRPDGHVAWRTTEPAEIATGELSRAIVALDGVSVHAEAAW